MQVTRVKCTSAREARVKAKRQKKIQQLFGDGPIELFGAGEGRFLVCIV